MAQKEIKILRDFPAVEELLQSPELSGSLNGLPRPLAVEIIRNSISIFKSEIKKRKKSFSRSDLIKSVSHSISSWKQKELQNVINATGVLVHTNLGRSPLGREVVEKISASISGYNNLELDLETGKRGSRGEICEKYLALLTGAESAAIVNNCAAALFIILNTFSQKKKVLLSRGELVQIGGEFRIPDILKRSGARLDEVGTTNITNLKDYSESIDKSASMILKVHRSNFVQSGFIKEVELSKLSSLAQKNKIILLHDLGSGAVFQTKKLLGCDEPTPLQS
ncbi:MAG TPA: L-seryl-tRNA(Sec) selenium transferase, partial [candidate division Zixibacteria bacterium]|nr:L-seryl-tRNA(Sec) selenium transferase [candidate division Zixibacteria bacterium]